MNQNYLSAVVILFFALSCNAQVKTYDGFEKQELSKIWSSNKLAPNSLEIQSQIVRSGKHAAKITLHPGDIHESGNDSSMASERDELLEAKELESAEEQKYAYSFSIFIPDSFPIVPTRLVIAQWKQRCGENSCQDRSPVIAIRYESGKLFITLQTGLEKEILYRTEENNKGQWLDFQFKIKFSRTANGSIAATLNNKDIIHYTGITCYDTQYGFSSESSFYFKMGLYRDLMATPMTIYFDEYSKQKIAE